MAELASLVPNVAKWTSALRTGVGSEKAPRNRGADRPGRERHGHGALAIQRCLIPVVACASCAMLGLGTCTSAR